jgi:hypothetical protein
MIQNRFHINPLITGVLSVCVMIIASCSPWADDTRLKNQDLDKNLFELLQNNPDASTFVSILQKGGYDRFLQDGQSLTVFVPANNVLSSVNLPDEAAAKEWVQNYIAFMSLFAGDGNRFEVNNIRMINEKLVPINGALISGANVTKANIIGKNGVIHLIDNLIIERMNIWEYLQTLSGYNQVDIIRSNTEIIMDMEKSIRIGVDMNGRPVYDTVWTTRNALLETYPIGDESATSTYILLENQALDLLKQKYEKYFVRKDRDEQSKTIDFELASDFVLKYQSITQKGRFESVKDLWVDIDPADIKSVYNASNGIVYIASNADIKIYENKIKTQIIEAENYADRFSSNAWAVRYRDGASDGRDILLKGYTNNVIEYDTIDITADTVVHLTKTFRYTYGHEEIIIKSNNGYLKYTPTLYSTPYNIYWVAYDDRESHYTGFTDTLQRPLEWEQKLFVSFPEQPELVRNSDGTISNNFSDNTVMAAKSVAGVREEVLLTRFSKTTANPGVFVLDIPFEDSDEFGGGAEIISPTYGTAVFFVTNTAREMNTYSGLMFLDYIKIVPIVNPND